MAKETVQAVSQAELHAAQIEKDALTKKEAIISEAMQNSKTLISSMTQQALKEAKEKAAAADLQGEQMIEAAKQKAEKEVRMLEDLVKEKKQAAVSQVLSSII